MININTESLTKSNKKSLWWFLYIHPINRPLTSISPIPYFSSYLVIYRWLISLGILFIAHFKILCKNIIRARTKNMKQTLHYLSFLDLLGIELTATVSIKSFNASLYSDCVSPYLLWNAGKYILKIIVISDHLNIFEAYTNDFGISAGSPRTFLTAERIILSMSSRSDLFNLDMMSCMTIVST